MGLPLAPRSRRPLAWPISSSITREGMAASSSQVAKVCRRSWGPRRSRWASSARGRLHRGLVDPPQIGGRQRRPGTAGNAVATTGPREDQILRTGPAGQLAGDRLPDLVAHGHRPDAGQALGFGLEAAAEPAGLIADLDDLDPAQLGKDPAATQAQQLPAAQPGADLDEEVVAVERPTGSQEVADLLGVRVRRR
jgi:hypothetical protein